MDPGDISGADEGQRTKALRALAARYCWDMDPRAASTRENRVLLRVMDMGTWEDLLDLERVFGRAQIAEVLGGAEAGALSPRSWHFWHYRLGLADADIPPPPPPRRRLG